MNTLPEAQIRSVIPDLSRRKPWSRSLNGATRPSQRRSNIRRWIWGAQNGLHFSRHVGACPIS